MHIREPVLGAAHRAEPGEGATPRPAKFARPARVSVRRAPGASRRLPDGPASRFAALLPDRLAGRETESTESMLNAL